MLTSWIKLITLYLIVGTACVYPLSQSSVHLHIPFVLAILGIVVFMSQFQSVFFDDFQDDHLAWCLAHQLSPLQLISQKLINSLFFLIIPLSIAYTLNLLFWIPARLLFSHLLAFSLTLLSLSGWSLLLTLAQGKNQSVLILFILPLAIPSLLITQSLFSAIALGHEASYYLAMQGGLALFSIAISALLSPLVIRSISW